jgi:hypothetical protein
MTKCSPALPISAAKQRSPSSCPWSPADFFIDEIDKLNRKLREIALGNQPMKKIRWWHLAVSAVQHTATNKVRKHENAATSKPSSPLGGTGCNWRPLLWGLEQ